MQNENMGLLVHNHEDFQDGSSVELKQTRLCGCTGFNGPGCVSISGRQWPGGKLGVDIVSDVKHKTDRLNI